MIPTGYQIYLMLELAKLHNIIDEDESYDLAWDDATNLYKGFQKSSFDIDTEPEYECIEKYIKTKHERDWFICHYFRFS